MLEQILSIVVLLLVFLCGTLRPVNLGALALVATFAVGALLVGEDTDKVLSGFPADLFILLFGVTYLFAVASVNGTVDWLVNAAARAVRGNAAALPWVIFFLSAVPTTAGALGPAGVALLAPIALRLAAKYDIDRRLAGLMVVHGSAVGNFSPINALGAIVNGTMERSGLPTSPMGLFAANLGYNLALGIVIYFVYGGADLIRRIRGLSRSAISVTTKQLVGSAVADARASTVPAVAGSPGSAPLDSVEPEEERVVGMDGVRVCTLISILAVACGALVFDLDIGMLAVAAAVLLNLVFSERSAGAVAKVSWGTVLLICGIVTYVGLLQRMGTVDMIGDKVVGVGSPMLAALLVCAIAAAVSAVASSTGILGALIPLSVPFLVTGQIDAIGVIIAVAISATVVDATPFSTVGALVLANAPEEERRGLYRGLILWGLSMVATAPLVTWALFVLV